MNDDRNIGSINLVKLRDMIERLHTRIQQAWRDTFYVPDRIDGRRELMFGAAAGAAVMTANPKSALGGLAAMADAAAFDAAWEMALAEKALIEKAAQSYVFRTGAATAAGKTPGMIETLKQIHDRFAQALPSNHPTIGMPPGTPNPSYEQAAELAEQLLKDHAQSYRRGYEVFETLAERQDLSRPIAREIADMTGGNTDQIFGRLRNSQQMMPSREAVEREISKAATEMRHQYNRRMVEYYGKPLPNTSPQELERIEQDIRSNLKKELTQDLPASVHATRFASDDAQGYVLSTAGKDEKSDDALHQICATLMVRYPYDLVFSVDGKNSFVNERSLTRGLINLVPTDHGIYVIMPPQREQANLKALDGCLSELVEQTKAEQREALKGPPIIARG